MKKWNTITKGSKIVLDNDTTFETLSGNTTIKAGEYYIAGFWANLCGLSHTSKEAYDETRFTHISSQALTKFNNISNEI